jgi:hypothetical protein
VDLVALEPTSRGKSRKQDQETHGRAFSERV